MMPHCQSDSQFELFESPAPSAERSPKLALPFQLSQQIDAKRLRNILGVSNMTVNRLLRAGLFRHFQLPGGYRIEYDSVIDYCDRLCLHYRIPRKSRRAKDGVRVRDRELLPFPMDETVFIREVRERLDCSNQAVQHLIDEGALTAYQLQIESPASDWRIHAPSLERYIASLHAQTVSNYRPVSSGT